MLPVQFMKPHRRVMYLFNRENTSARKHNAEAHSLRADLEWKLNVRPGLSRGCTQMSCAPQYVEQSVQASTQV